MLVVLLLLQHEVVLLVHVAVIGKGQCSPESPKEFLLPVALLGQRHIARWDDVEHIAVPLVRLQPVNSLFVGGGKGMSVRYHHSLHTLSLAGDGACDISSQSRCSRQQQSQEEQWSFHRE